MMNKKENTRTNTKTHLILKIGMLLYKLNPNFYEEVTSKWMEEMRKKSREELRDFIEELKKEGSERK